MSICSTATKATTSLTSDPTNSFDPDGSWNGPAQRIATIGTRWKSKKDALGPWIMTVELAYQWGDVWRPIARHQRSIITLLPQASREIHRQILRLGIPRFGALVTTFASGDRQSGTTDARNRSRILFPSNHETLRLDRRIRVAQPA
jgi:hypothetical protein